MVGVSILSQPKFEVTLEIHKLTRIAQPWGRMVVKWHTHDSPHLDSRGSTEAVKIDNHQCIFNTHATFKNHIVISLSKKELRKTEITFEVWWEPPGHHKMIIGQLELDLAQFVNRDLEPMSFLLEGGRTNCLLNLSLSLKQLKGSTHFNVPLFTAPVLRTDFLSNVTSNNKCNGQKRCEKYLDHRRIRNLFSTYSGVDSIYSSQMSAVECIKDIARGGDGFDPSATRPRIKIPHHLPGTPYTEDEIRTSAASWKISGSDLIDG